MLGLETWLYHLTLCVLKQVVYCFMIQFPYLHIGLNNAYLRRVL